ncbi:uncharacterized protein LOC100373492 [Saccoglossus kowalevskii]|uniref:Uncharacterized protein LOC100373492 n=1 Tax=Saccoglossus kowalevskii TaxID=10224 RepID=A0ABM0GZA7_SACKO|nr:PREDICTED: uncharacterized protein LOC100373492 [Saccoglossus kowalevskii]
MAATTNQKYPSTEEVWDRFNKLKDRVDERLHVKDTFDRIVEYGNEHPIVALSVIVAVALASIPVVVFVSFAITTIFISFLGFVFVEGTLLTFGGVVLSAILFFIAIFVLGLCLLATAAWFTFDMAVQVMHTAQDRFQNRAKYKHETDVGKKIVDAAEKDCH